LNESGGAAIAVKLSENMRKLLSVTSQFLGEENFTMLLSAIKAVNTYKPEQGLDLEVNDNWSCSNQATFVSQRLGVISVYHVTYFIH
jgi:hypothetical protein